MKCPVCEKGNRAEAGYVRQAGGQSVPREVGELLLDGGQGRRGRGAPGSGTRQARGREERGRLVGRELGTSSPSGAGRGPPQGAWGQGGTWTQACPRAEGRGCPWTERGWLGPGADCQQGLWDQPFPVLGSLVHCASVSPL